MEIEKIKKELEIKEGLSCDILSSDIVSNNSGIIIVIYDYCPLALGESSINLSIALSSTNSAWEPKCWVSKNIRKMDNNYPLPHSDYKEFEHEGHTFFPYSTNLNNYQLEICGATSICGGLFNWVKKATNDGFLIEEQK